VVAGAHDGRLRPGRAGAARRPGNYGPTEGRLLPFHKGFAHFAIKAGVPVVPVALSGTKDLWFRKRIKVVIGPAIPTKGEDPAALTQLAFDKMTALLPAYTEPSGRKLLRNKLTHLF
jgi:1-acyl-sn-glycerol-3-phosphate acyltransferase